MSLVLMVLDPEKIKSIVNFEEPKNNTEVRRFLGVANQLGKVALRTYPMPLNHYEIRSKNQCIWGADHERLFEEVKTLFSSEPVQALYDHNKDTVVSAASSAYGLGALLLSLPGDRLTVECLLRSFAPHDHRVTNQTYLSTTRKTGSTNLSQSECLIMHCLISECGAACIRLEIEKADWSLCNQAVQNSEINILPLVSPLTVVIISGKWIIYAPRVFSDAEKRYAQFKTEALATTTWACERFHDYLAGKLFHIETDHKPIVSLWKIKDLGAARI